MDGGFGSFEQIARNLGHGVIFGGVLLGFFDDFLFVDTADDVVAIDADVATFQNFGHVAPLGRAAGGLRAVKGMV